MPYQHEEKIFITEVRFLLLVLVRVCMRVCVRMCILLNALASQDDFDYSQEENWCFDAYVLMWKYFITIFVTCKTMKLKKKS